jgi:hypothetical protein
VQKLNISAIKIGKRYRFCVDPTDCRQANSIFLVISHKDNENNWLVFKDENFEQLDLDEFYIFEV